MKVEKKTHFGERTVGDIVAEDYRLGSVFKRFGIDFCCGGGRTVEAACAKAGVSYDDLEAALISAASTVKSVGRPDAGKWSPDFLADYIVNVHHGYVRQSLPILRQFAWKVARVHGDAEPQLVAISRLFEELAAELETHIVKEEEVLFPYIRALVHNREKRSNAPFASIEAPITALEHEHDTAGEIMRRIREFSSDFTPPDHACNTYRALFAKLEEFEEDLHWHIHLENNVLFPKAAALEKKAAS